METELGDLLQFEDLLDNRKLLFYPKICASQIKEIQQAGLYFRDALLPNISTISWPPKHVELCESAVKLELDAFLYTLLTGNTHIPAEYPDRLRALLIHLRSYTRTTKTTQANTVTVCQTVFNLSRCHTDVGMGSFLCLKLSSHISTQHSRGTISIDWRKLFLAG